MTDLHTTTEHDAARFEAHHALPDDPPSPAEYADLAGAASTRRITTTPTWCETCNADVWACIGHGEETA